jgi:hypothetical protein
VSKSSKKFWKNRPYPRHGPTLPQKLFDDVVVPWVPGFPMRHRYPFRVARGMVAGQP